MCLAQWPQHSDTSETQTRGPSVSSQALYHWATVLPLKSLKTIWILVRPLWLFSQTPCIHLGIPRGGGGGRGGTLIFSHIRRLGPFFWVQNSEISIFLGVFRKINIFGGMKILWIFFWGHHKIGLVWGSFLCNLRSRYRIGIFFWVAKISNIF